MSLKKYHHFRFKLYVVVLLLLTLIYFISPYQLIVVTGESMNPTLKSGQVVILNKKERNPKPDDIVVIYKNRTFFIKRVLMTYENRFLIVNYNIDYHDGFIYLKNRPFSSNYSKEKEARIKLFIEHAKKNLPPSLFISLKPDEYWVEGDNRAHSEDSRVFGVVKQSEIIGTCHVD